MPDAAQIVAALLESDLKNLMSYEEMLAYPQKAWEYALELRTNGQPIPRDVELAIARDGHLALSYAMDILNSWASTGSPKPFPEGEDAIAKNPSYSLAYALNVLKGRFLKGEAAIWNNRDTAYSYAYNVLHGLYPEGPLPSEFRTELENIQASPDALRAIYNDSEPFVKLTAEERRELRKLLGGEKRRPF